MASKRAENHQLEQAGLAALIGRLIAQAWASLLDPHDLKQTSPRLTVAVESIIKHYGQASSAHALSSYRQQRREAGIAGRIALKMPPAPTHDDVAAMVEHTLHDLYGPVTPDLERRVQEALTSQTENLVLDQSRQALINASTDDRDAIGWARITEEGACSFCRLLATRGAVYTSRGSGDFRAHTKKPDGSGGTCRCHVEPVFNHYEPSAQVRQDQADYRRLTDEFGHSGRAIHIAWRQHVEGRPVTGPRTKPYTHTK